MPHLIPRRDIKAFIPFYFMMFYKKLSPSLVCFIALSATLNANDQAYEMLTDLPYYDGTTIQSDPYIEARCKLDLYYPTNVKDFATVVWFHGGGLRAGKKSIAERLQNQGIAVIAVNYRLHPRVEAPKYIEDAAAAIAWAFKNIESYGGSVDKIFVSGSSAGAYLSALVGLDKTWLAAHEIDANRIAGLIPLAGTMFTHFTIGKEKGLLHTQPSICQYAPVSHLRIDTPPILLVTGDRERETYGRYEENAYMHRMLLQMGHQDVRLFELDGYKHAPNEPFFPLLLEEVRRVLKKGS